MSLKGFLKFKFFLLISVVMIGASFSLALCAQAAFNLNGRILLQVQDKGQAWYVNPVNSKRYYLGRPNDAFNVMRALGLGVSNADLNIFLTKAPARLAGRILLQVQDKGQAYYVDPQELKLYYLGRPDDAFSIMRTKGLGITNRDLETIPIATLNISPVTISPTSPLDTEKIQQFTFKYKNNNYELIQSLSTTLYNSYKNSVKVYSYFVGHEPLSVQEEFYGLFLKTKSGDTTLAETVNKLKTIATDNNWSEDELLEFIVAFVQYIPYDSAKAAIDLTANSNPYFPYETLYLNKGVCSDKTFLAVLLLRELGYGAAILDFPERNHSALGVECPKEYSLNNSGYCYAETTNYFPLGVIPQSINKGQAQTAGEFNNLFDSSSLGKIEIYQATNGKVYQGMPALRSKIESLRALKEDISLRQTEVNNLNVLLLAKEAESTALKSQMDAYYNNGQRAEYNALVPSYNSLVGEYNAALIIYQTKVNEYNAKISEFNALTRLFYQQ